MAFDTGPIATENQFPCRTLVACLDPGPLPMWCGAGRGGRPFVRPDLGYPSALRGAGRLLRRSAQALGDTRVEGTGSGGQRPKGSQG